MGKEAGGALRLRAGPGVSHLSLPSGQRPLRLCQARHSGRADRGIPPGAHAGGKGRCPLRPRLRRKGPGHGGLSPACHRRSRAERPSPLGRGRAGDRIKEKMKNCGPSG